MSFWLSRKSEIGLQQWLKPRALTHQLKIGKTDLPLRRPRHRSTPVALRSSGALSLQRLDVSRCRLVQQILQSLPVIQAALNLRYKLFRYVDGNATPIRATVKHITLMLLARPARWTIFPDTPASP
jgi:hypothetical protein